MSKNLFFVIFIIVLLGAGLYLFINQGSAPVQTVEEQGAADAEIEKIRADINELQQVKDLTLDTAIFDDPLFLNLREPARNPAPIPSSGRRNPFAPF